MATNIFEQASRKDLRFKTSNGQVGVSDLWKIPLTELNNIAVALHNRVNANSVTFLTDPKKTKEKAQEQLAFDIAKHIIDTRQAEDARKADRLARKARRNKILEEIENREGEERSKKTVAELRAELQALDNEEDVEDNT